MKQTINFNNFVDAFHLMDRGNQFSYVALKAIFEYIEDYERDTGEETELDVIAICCEFSELSLTEVIQSYDVDADDFDSVLEYLEYKTNVIWYDRNQELFLIQDF